MEVVEDLDGLEGRCPDLTSCGEPGSVHELGFERTEETLHRGIAEAITLTAHGDLDIVEAEQLEASGNLLFEGACNLLMV